jgi:hypothetical protein
LAAGRVNVEIGNHVRDRIVDDDVDAGVVTFVQHAAALLPAGARIPQRGGG